MTNASPTDARVCTGKGRVNRDIPLGQLRQGGGPKFRPSRRGKWRAATLIGVHALIAAHIAQWLIRGRTLSPVEPSESMYTLEKGEMNAGFIFFCAAILSTLVFGRFFCGWGCHIVALQDLCGWIMKKCGVRPKPFRSRLLMYVPLLLALYMFVWPTLKREAVAPLVRGVWPEGEFLLGAVPGRPTLTNHMIVTDFWATFASVGVAIPFLLVCGFATVYFLGAKGFCTYGCPYGGFFGPADYLAPGKIILDDEKCEHCGHCSAACTSNVRVHEEIREHGMVVSPGCMKCMDCVNVCPNGALRYGFTTPTLFNRRARAKAKAARAGRRRVYDLSWREEFALAGLFALVFYAARGAWGVVPMLFAAGVAGCVTFVAWKAFRTLRERDVRLNSFQLRRRGALTGAGWVCVAGGALLVGSAGALGAVKGAVKWNALAGDALDYRVTTPAGVALSGDLGAVRAEDRAAAAGARERYERALRWTRFGSTPADAVKIEERVAWLSLVLGEPARAEAALRRLLAAQGPSDALLVNLSRVVRLSRGPVAAEESLRGANADHPALAGVRRELAGVYAQSGRVAEAIALYERALAEAPDDAGTMAAMASLHVSAGDFGRAIDLYRRAVAVEPANPTVRHDLAVALFLSGRRDEAVAEMEGAAAMAAQDPSPRRTLAQMLREMGREAEAAQWEAEAERLERGASGGGR